MMSKNKKRIRGEILFYVEGLRPEKIEFSTPVDKTLKDMLKKYGIPKEYLYTITCVFSGYIILFSLMTTYFMAGIA